MLQSILVAVSPGCTLTRHPRLIEYFSWMERCPDVMPNPPAPAPVAGQSPYRSEGRPEDGIRSNSSTMGRSWDCWDIRYGCPVFLRHIWRARAAAARSWGEL
ncbi:hypothetical protein GCM10020229_17800 [Kitasatospora albolonga]